ncbi:PTS sugar transporter subunit IIB [Corticicoccus populi]|uniref:PTS sugar transporter subunit IIB n=1 Tax=Corticicoccus populi TaxID=1812821 RepID=A0ABW5WV95_9STAP
MKVRLVCSAGMSTSMLVRKIKEEAEKEAITMDISAVGAGQLNDHVENLDVVLIGPQVRYLEGKIKEALSPKGIKVAVIDQMAYGMMDGKKVLEQIQSM